MSQPFDLGKLGALGDLSALDDLVGNMTRSLDALGEQAGSIEAEGQAGGGVVRVVANGHQELVRVHIEAEALKDREMLEDLLLVAANDALRKSKEVLAAQASALTGFSVPPGLR
jgi:nucleoid-associated protein EbfC